MDYVERCNSVQLAIPVCIEKKLWLPTKWGEKSLCSFEDFDSNPGVIKA